MDLIQSNGQPHYGRFSELPKTIDLNKYQYQKPHMVKCSLVGGKS